MPVPNAPAPSAPPAPGVHADNTDALQSGWSWGSSVLSYSFPDSGSDYSYGIYNDEPDTFEALNAAQMAAVETALAMVSAVAAVTFTEYTGALDDNAALRFGETDGTGTAHAYYPTGGTQESGDVWFNKTHYNNPEIGTYAFHTVMHEIGHAMGLEHGHNNLTAEYDAMAYSVMTYRSHQGSSLTGYTNEGYGNAQTLMIYDIAALQEIYGVNWETNADDSTYTFDPETGAMRINGETVLDAGGDNIFLTIFDGGGSDTLDFSNYAENALIDLRPGQGSRFSEDQLARLDWADGGIYADHNVYLALLPDDDARALIENAIGGSGRDTIHGNRTDNEILGGGARDKIYGYDGEDILKGNKGKDKLWGHKHRDILEGQKGDDMLFGGAGRDILRGGDGNDRLNSGAGNDVLTGGRGADVFVFQNTTGTDVITDFEVGVDRIQISSPGEAVLTSYNGHLAISFGDAMMVLRDIEPDSLTLDDIFMLT